MSEWVETLVAAVNPTLLSSVWFLCVVSVLDLLDVYAPLEERVGTAGAVVAAAAVILGEPVAAAISVAASVLVIYLRRNAELGSCMRLLWVRPAGLLLSGAMLQAATYIGAEVSLMMRATVIATVLLLSEQFGPLIPRAHRAGISLSSQLLTGVAQRGALVLAEASTVLLTVLIWGEMRGWALLPVLAILVLIRQSYGTYLEIRDTYLASVRVLMRAAEAQDCGRSGHAERVSDLAYKIGLRCGLRPAELEVLAYAALLHDVDRLVDGLTGDERDAGGYSARVVKSTGSFPSVVPVLEIVDGTDKTLRATATVLTQAFVVALASDIDHVIMDGAQAQTSATARVAAHVPARIKARVTSAALELGHPIPAIDRCW